MPRSEKHPDWPSVTEVLADVGLARHYPDTPGMERLRARGRALHLAIQYHHEGVLDEATVHPEVLPGLEAYRAFLEETAHVPAYSEVEVEHPHGVVGHIDRVGALASYPVALIDYKYTDSVDVDAARLQLAGYRLCWGNEGLGRAERCYVLQLSPTSWGKWRLHDVTDDYAEQEFVAALIVWRAKQRGKR